MADPLLELLLTGDSGTQDNPPNVTSTSTLSKYLSRLLSLRPSDLTTTEPQSLSQSSQSNLLQLQALSSRSHRSTTASSDQLASLRYELPTFQRTVTEIRDAVPRLDESTVNFASTYSRACGGSSKDDEANNALSQRKASLLLSRQAPALQDILELPALLRTAIASAASGPTGSANYSQALDLYAHIKRLQILYPESRLVGDVQVQAEDGMKEMTVNLLAGLRGGNLRLASAIRTIGWLRRVVPDLGSTSIVTPSTSTKGKAATYTSTSSYSYGQEEQSEGSFGALFLAARLATFLSMTEDALAPLRDLADQETEKRLQEQQQSGTANSNATADQPQQTRRVSSHTPSHTVQGQQTERYLKRYIEIFREQSFGTVQMFRNVFPQPTASCSTAKAEDEQIRLPSALASFPLHLVGLLMETLQMYLPNIGDTAARESLLVQVLYAAGSLGRLGCDFSMFISQLDLPGSGEVKEDGGEVEPEWYRIIKKHKVQAARLDAMASGQERRVSQDVAVR